MTSVLEPLARFPEISGSLPGQGLPWLGAIRKFALSRFADLGWPTNRQEDWRFTEVGPISNMKFVLAAKTSVPKIDEFSLCSLDAYRLVFVNGRYQQESSLLPAKGAGITVGSISEFLKTEPARLEPYLARFAGEKGQAFAALNTAFFSDGALVFLPKGAVVDKPIHLLFITTTDGRAAMSHERVLIVAEPGAKAVVVEEYAGAGGVYFNNVVTEILIGEAAVIEHYKLEREAESAFHVATLQAHQARNSVFAAHSIALGGALVRNDVNVFLEAEGADCSLNGLYLVRGRQHLDNHTVIDHVSPHGTSRELYKGVLDGQSRAIFNGSISVRPAAQKTNARVYNKNLLLSEKCLINTKPDFKINANDVQCKHGATIGQISEDALFYLRSRGISRKAARSLLVYAFASEMVSLMSLEPLKAGLTQALRAWLPGAYED